MRRIITIILIVLVIAAVILLGAWLFSRKSAEKKGQATPTFRQFLSGETSTTLQPNETGNLSSVFVDNNLATSTQNDTTPTIGTQVATFTNSSGVSSPVYTSSSGGPSSAGTTSPNSVGSGDPTPTVTTTTTTADPTTQTPVSVSPVVTGPECTDADLNIRFTADEIARLNTLQNRFYALAQVLHTDADVAVETGNHDNFAAKVAEISELYNKCQEYTIASSNNSSIHGVITDPVYQKRVPTPFWHNLATDTQLFVGTPGDYDGGIGGNGTWDGSVNGLQPHPPNNTPLVLRSLERSLRLNIW